MRLFVSVDLPDGLASAVSEVQSLFADADGVRPVDPEQAHVTLKFLGEVDGDRVDDILEGLDTAVDRAAVEPFEVHLNGLGVFPDLEYISVIWVGTDRGGNELTTLHEAVEAELVDRGFDPEEHSFTPHVTIARMDHAGGKSLVQRVVREHSPAVGRFDVEAISLTESTLTPSGPAYEPVETVSLPTQ